MNIGLFTDTYFPQLSGVATSIQTLKNALEKMDTLSLFLLQQILIWVKELLNLMFLELVAFLLFLFTDRRIAFRGLFQATKIAMK